MSSRWKIAQKSEKRCWQNVREKLINKEYQRCKTNYCKKILDKLKKNIKLNESVSFLDFGCGPNGLVLIYPKKTNLVCLDPLMESYLKWYPYLSKYKAKYISKKIEEFSSKQKFEYLFGFNCLDHVDSISITLKKVYSMLSKRGFLIISINCHNYKFLQKLLLKFSFILDKPHPHQYLLKHYKNFLKDADFKILKLINIDNESLYMSKMNKSLQGIKKELSLKSLIRSLFHPFTLINLIGMKTFGKEKEKTIYSTYIIIAKKIKYNENIGKISLKL